VPEDILYELSLVRLVKRYSCSQAVGWYLLSRLHEELRRSLLYSGRFRCLPLCVSQQQMENAMIPVPAELFFLHFQQMSFYVTVAQAKAQRFATLIA